MKDRALAWGLGALALALAVPRALDYGLTWDEPGYFHFARLQRAWIQDLVRAPFGPIRLDEVLSRARIAQVWLQDPWLNGHPPLHETWQGLVSLPLHWAGVPDAQAFRISICLLLAITCGLLYLLLRTGCSRAAAVSGTLAYAGTPVIWAHGHLGATETMQNFFWVLLAWVLPQALEGRRRWIGIWLLGCALGFLSKFTNLLIPICLLGTAGVLGALRRFRFWLLVGLGVVVAPLCLLILDPYFWPWQGGWARFVDYLAQVRSRSEWVPISVYYLGKNWGFRPPWHYRPVETLVALPVPLLVLLLLGIPSAFRSLWRQLRRQRITCWPAALGLCGAAFSWLVGLVPGAPNHDSTRQFIFIFVFIAVLAGYSADRVLAWTRRLGVRGGRTVGLLVVLGLSAGCFAISLRSEPWGLAYRSEWIGGTAGAWKRGFEVSFWGDAISPAMMAAAAGLEPIDGGVPYILSVPKYNYATEARDFWKPFVPEALRGRDQIFEDARPAYYDAWVAAEHKKEEGDILRLTFRRPLDGILYFDRRNTIAASFEDALRWLEREGDLELVQETRVDGVVLARLYRVKRQVPVRIPYDPGGYTWYQPREVSRITGWEVSR